MNVKFETNVNNGFWNVSGKEVSITDLKMISSILKGKLSFTFTPTAINYSSVKKFCFLPKKCKSNRIVFIETKLKIKIRK